MEGYLDISRDVLREKMLDREENFTLIEVLPKVDYEQGHLPQALNIPLGDISLMVPRLVPNLYEDLVVYCSGPDCDVSRRAAELLVSLGYEDVKHYAGGKSDWAEAGLPIEGGGRERVA